MNLRGCSYLNALLPSVLRNLPENTFANLRALILAGTNPNPLHVSVVCFNSWLLGTFVKGWFVGGIVSQMRRPEYLDLSEYVCYRFCLSLVCRLSVVYLSFLLCSFYKAALVVSPVISFLHNFVFFDFVSFARAYLTFCCYSVRFI